MNIVEALTERARTDDTRLQQIFKDAVGRMREGRGGGVQSVTKRQVQSTVKIHA